MKVKYCMVCGYEFKKYRKHGMYFCPRCRTLHRITKPNKDGVSTVSIPSRKLQKAQSRLQTMQNKG